VGVLTNNIAGSIMWTPTGRHPCWLYCSTGFI